MKLGCFARRGLCQRLSILAKAHAPKEDRDLIRLRSLEVRIEKLEPRTVRVNDADTIRLVHHRLPGAESPVHRSAPVERCHPDRLIVRPGSHPIGRQFAIRQRQFQAFD